VPEVIHVTLMAAPGNGPGARFKHRGAALAPLYRARGKPALAGRNGRRGAQRTRGLSGGMSGYDCGAAPRKAGMKNKIRG